MSQDGHKLSVFPAFFRVKDRYVLVVGSGAAALAKIRLVAETSALIVVVAQNPEPQLCACLQKMTRAGGSVRWIDAPFNRTMLDGAVLVFAATGDMAQDCAVAEMAGRVHIPVNVVDCPDLCDFFTPALVNRAPVAVAIGSEGTGPVLTQLIRARIEALLCPELGRLARFAGRFREKADVHIAKGSLRRRFWREFFSGAVARAVLRGDESAADEHALKLLGSGQDSGYQLCLLYVGHGMADWLTLGGQRALMAADTIVHDGDVADDILGMVRRETCLLPVTSSPLFSARLVKKLCGGDRQVLRLVTDEARLDSEAALLGAYGVDFEIIPSLPVGAVVLRGTAHPLPCATS